MGPDGVAQMREAHEAGHPVARQQAVFARIVDGAFAAWQGGCVVDDSGRTSAAISISLHDAHELERAALLLLDAGYTTAANPRQLRDLADRIRRALFA